RGRAVALAARLVGEGEAGIEAAGSLQTHLHYAEQFTAAAEVGEQVFAAGPRSPAQTAFEIACSWARAGPPGAALRWVEAALAAVRALPGWAAVRRRLSA